MHAGLHSEAQSAVAPAPATGEVDDGRTVELAEGGRAGRGDVVLSTENDRRLRYGIDHVRNGTAWAVEAVGDGGALRVRLAGGRAHVTLPAEYVGDHVALAYARTTNVVQSRTVGTSHTLVDPDAMARSGLYVGASRGEERNTMHVVTEQLIGLGEGETSPARTVEEVLARVIERDARERSASEILAAGLDRLGPEEVTRLREEQGRLRARLDGPDVPVEPRGIEVERAQRALADARRDLAAAEDGTIVHGRFGRTRTVHDQDAVDRARVSVSDRTRDLDDVTERGRVWREWREQAREDQAELDDVDHALRTVVHGRGRDDATLDRARERDLERAELEYDGP